ncbi:hypothetical protein [Vallitalea sp.]|jgi:hypothetical protein|uniref:hypothetical protein n=1 Tax=Vallitalea sp. TaxID=1882829 RepID=UPI0025E291E2|nr:hypothetical protein [Vallitalea sp.]MCT4686574.1 hypothetical protein [Vallitalea sp.]
MNKMTNSKTSFEKEVSATRNQDDSNQVIVDMRYCVGKDESEGHYLAITRRLREGGLLIFQNLSELGKNSHQIQREWTKLIREEKVDIIVLEPQIISTISKGDLEAELIYDTILGILRLAG